MKVLHVLPYVPVPLIYGGAIRCYHILRALALQHEVTVVAFGSKQDGERLLQHFHPLLKEVRTVDLPWINRYRRLTQLYALWSTQSFFSLSTSSQEMQETIDDLVAETEFDVVQFEFPIMAKYEIRCNAIRILDQHNVEYDNFRRMWMNSNSSLRQLHYFSEYSKIRREEIDVCRNQDIIFVTSERDRELLERDVRTTPKFIVPNGVDISYFTPSSVEPEPHSIVFTGRMNYVPNHDGMVFFLDEIFPLILREIPDAKLYIVGDQPPRRLSRRVAQNVTVTGFVHDVRDYIRRAAVYVVPLRAGGGTRLKVLEAMAMKKPIVSTRIGCEGIDVTHGDSLLMADDPDEFAAHVIALMRDEALRRTLSENGYALAQCKYDWCTITSSIGSIYESLHHTSSEKVEHREVVNA